MKTMLWKDAVCEIKKSFGRFFAILAIVALGVSFFVGVTLSSDAMKKNADQYFDDTNYYDLHLLSTIGFTDEDLKVIRKMNSINDVFGMKKIDVLTRNETHEFVLTMLTIPNKDKVNQLVITDGRMPKNVKECLVDSQSSFKIGEELHFYSGTKKTLEESLKYSSCKIVGKANHPLYLSMERGTSMIGSGNVDAFVALLEDAFIQEYYTDVYITVKGMNKQNSYQKEYFELLEPTERLLENKGKERIQSRIFEIKEEARKELEKGKKEYEENYNLLQDQMKKAETELESGKEQLLLGKIKLENGKSSYEQMKTMGQAKIKEARKTLANGKIEYEENKKTFDQMKRVADETFPKLEAEIQKRKQDIEELEKQKTVIEEKLLDPSLSDEERKFYEKQKEIIDETIQSYQTYLPLIESEIQNTKNELQQAENKLKLAEQTILSAEREIQNEERRLQEGEITYKNETIKAEREIKENEQKLKEAEVELEQKKEDAEKELQLAKEKLDQAEYELNQETDEKWYVLNRKQDYSYMDYEGAANRMKSIAAIFPVFFFLVALLVCLTTVTRMVEEQRGIIGTYKALGYEKSSIAFKYVFYVLSASLIGGILGAIIGTIIFPKVIYSVWNIMYNLPDYQYVMDIPLSIFAILLMCICTLFAAIFSVYKELSEVPAYLMRPKAPKIGKKILLEKIPWIWNRFSFLIKVTSRNIFRYKKRFFMTVLGISGCTALLLAGFGIRDSVGDIVELQFEDIFQYDAILFYNNEKTYTETRKMYRQLKKEKGIEKDLEVIQKSAEVLIEGKTSNVTMVVPKNADQFSKFINLRTSMLKEKIPFQEDSVVITEKLAKERSIQVGDTITVTLGQEKVELRVSDITEHYVGHYLYIHPKLYEEMFMKSFEANAMLVQMEEGVKETEVGSLWMDYDGISSVTFYSSLAGTFKNMVSSLDLVTVILLVAAGTLAFIVLFNLTNVNISERLREIATIKVLGFYDKEVEAYVYRENIFLTIIGALVGLVLGVFLHLFIMNVAELDDVMFGRTIKWSSYLLSFVITIIFSLLVNLFMKRKLKKISMVESLKSVD